MKTVIQKLVKWIAGISSKGHKADVTLNGELETHKCTRSNFLFIPISEPDNEGYIWYACDHPGCKNIAMFHPLKGQKRFDLNISDSADEIRKSQEELERRIKDKIIETYKNA